MDVGHVMRWILVSLVGLLGCESAERAGYEEQGGETIADTTATQAELQVVDPATVDVLTGDPSDDDPVAVGAAVDRGEAKAGDVVLLVVRSKIAKPWHIYAVEGPTGVARPTKLELTLPDGVSIAADWKLPDAEVTDSPTGPVSIYQGDVRFSVTLKIAENAPASTFGIECEVRYQACEDSRCLPPTSNKLTVPLTIVSNKGA